MTQADRIRRYADLIQKQTGRAVRPYRADGYVNLITRYGTSKDQSEQYKFVPEEAVPDELLTMYYEGNGLFAKIIDTPAEEAIKHGFSLDDVADQEVEDFYSEALDELDWEETAMTAIKWARLFGGSIAVMLINDGRGLDEPLDWKNIQSIDDIRVFDRSLIQPDYASMFSYDPQDPFRTRGSRLGMPEFYQVFSKYGNFTVHDSRCLVFQNGILPENTTNSVYQLWGIPEYIRINRAIRDAEIAHRSAPKLLDRSVQPVYKMKDLSQELATEEGENVVLRRLQVIDMARGLLNSLVIDSDGEDYDFKTFQFTGVNDVVSASCNMLSAITNIPQTILFGQSVGGMSSTDDTSMENYYNYVERIQKRMLKSNLRYLLSVIFQAGLATGEVDEIPKLKVRFNPLWSLSDTEQADLDLKKAQIQQTKASTAQIYVQMEAIDPSEVRKKLADSEEFDVENMLDEYDEEDLFAGMQEQMGAPEGESVPGDAATGAVGSIPQQGDFDQYAQNVSVEEHNADPDNGGNAPTAAPAATKLPQDMSDREVYQKAWTKADRRDADIQRENDLDGGSGSGNYGHKGVPGQVGGSAPAIGGDDEEGLTPKQLVEHRMAKAGYSKKTLNSIRTMFDAHTAGRDSQKEADEEIAKHISSGDEIGKALEYKATLEEEQWKANQEHKYAKVLEHYESELEWAKEQLKPGGIYESQSDLDEDDLVLYGILPKKPERTEPKFYRKGGMDKDVLSFTTNENGAGMSFLTNGEAGYIGHDVSYTLKEMQEMGFRPIAGIQSMDVGMPGEDEVLFAKFPQNTDGRYVICRNPSSVGVLVISDGKILSGTRHNDFGYGLICGPGGHVEEGETPEQAAFRETEEEFGISPKELIPLGHGPKEPDTGLAPELFLCTVYDGEPECLDLEMAAPEFRSLEELAELDASLFQPFKDSLEILKKCLALDRDDGGPGSGNFGHAGRPGKTGGSAPDCGGLTKLSPENDFTRNTSFGSATLKLRRGEPLNEYEAKVVEQADSAMQAISASVMLYRSCGDQIEKGVFSKKEQSGWKSYEDVAKSWEGKEFSDKGYVYTSTDEKATKEYGSDYRMRITAKPGTKAVWGGGQVGDEIVLGREQSFKVTGAHVEDGRTVILDVEISG